MKKLLSHCLIVCCCFHALNLRGQSATTLADTSILSAARALAEMRRDYPTTTLDSFCKIFSTQFAAVGLLLNDATIWNNNLIVSNKQILNCRNELERRSLITKLYRIAVDSLSGIPDYRAKIPHLTKHLHAYIFLSDSAKLTIQSEFGEDTTIYRHKMLKIVGKLLDAIPHTYASRMLSPSQTWAMLQQAYATKPPEIVSNRELPNSTTIKLPFGVSEQELLWGLTNFIVDRFKSEIQSSFFDRLQSLMRQSHAHEFFPESVRLLDLDALSQKFANIQHTSELSGCFRAAIERDLRQMPENILTAVNRDQFLDSIGITGLRRDEVRYLRGSLDMISLLRKGEHPRDILDALSLRYDSINSQPFDRQIQFLQLITKNLQNTKKSITKENNEQYWSSFEVLKTEYNLEDLPKYFVALLYHQDEKLFTALNITSKFNKQSDIIFRRINRIIFALNQTEIMLTKTRRAVDRKKEKIEEDSLRFSYYIQYAASMFDAVNQVISFSENGSTQNDKYTKWLNLAQRFSETAKAAETRNYFSLMDNTVILLNELGSLIQDSSKKQSFKRFVSGFSLYGAFAADLIYAKDEAQVKAVLSRYALPTGSALVKRRGNSHLHINAYAGVFLGSEILKPNAESNELNRFLISLSAPVGIDYSMVDSKNRAWSVFASFIDLGAMFSYRLADGQISSTPEISFSNVFAPGLFLFRHLRSTPLSIGASVQLSPRLRELTQNSAKVNAISAYRFGISAKVDIPIFRLGTRYSE